ncbi:MAG: hypothetical protein GY927_05500 [bacterium]|nr:hypothetical protein [bacterium]
MTFKYHLLSASTVDCKNIAFSFVLALACQMMVAGGAQARGASVYTIAKVKIDARADNAVLAKKRAFKEGPLQALKLIFKRLAPFRAYDRLANLTPAEADEVVDGFAVRSERNSSTHYIALLDYKFSRKKLQALLIKKGVPFFDQRSQKQVLMPVFRGTGDQSAGTRKSKQWWRAWRTIDFKHALTDTRLYQAKQSDHELWQKISSGERQQYETLRDRYAASKLILVDAQLNSQKDRFELRIYGKDHVGRVDYSQEIPVKEGTLAKNYEVVAQIAFGILEGRWREPQISGDVVAVIASANDQNEAESSKRLINETVFLRVAFRGLRNWQQIRKRLQRIPGVQKMQVNSLSPRGADVRLKYPGGIDRLQSQLSAYRFALEQTGSDAVLRSVK